MKLVTLFLFSSLIFAWGTQVFAQADDAGLPKPVVLADEQGEYPLGLHLEILEDPSGELTIEDVASPEFDSRFVPSQVEVPNYGFTDSAYWTRVRLRNETSLVRQWLLEVGFANMQFVDLYSPSPSGEGFDVKQSGSLRHVSTRDIRYQHIVFELTPPAQSEQTYYLRFKNDASMTLLLTLWSTTAFLTHTQQDLPTYGLFFGVMLGLLGYNFFLLYSLREKSYLFLTLFIANMMFFEATYAGFLETFVFPDLYALKAFYLPISFSLIFVWALLFSHSFLEVQARIPILHRAIIAFLVVWGVLIILVPFTSFIILARLMVPLGVLSLMMLLAVGIVSWQQGFRPARFFLIAWAGLAVTLTLVMLVRLGMVTSTGFTESAYHPGIMWMVVCWSIALADRINLLRSESEGTNRELRKSKRRLAQILEGLPLGVVVYGIDSKPSFLNRRVIEILGNPAQSIEPDLAAGRTLAEAMQYYSFRMEGSDRAYPIEKLPVYRALQGESASADDAEADLGDRRVPLEIWASPVMDDTGNVESAVVAFQDISARKQAEMALRASEKKFRVVVENNFEGIVFMAHDRQVLYVSPSYERLNGMSAEEMIGQSGVGFVHPDDRACIAEVFRELLQRPGSRRTVEYRSRHQDGSWFWVETNAINLLDDPHVRAVVLNIRNINERKQTEAELAEYRKSLEILVAKRTAELNATNEWLSALKRIRQTIGGTADLPQAYDKLFDSILQMLDAKAAFLLRWDGQGGQVETVCHRQRDDAVHALDGIASIVKNDSPLRKKIELGEPIHMSADQVAALPASIGEFFQEDGSRSFLLMPMIAGQSVAGVLGVALHQPKQEITPAQIELVKTITIDLADLAEGTQLLDQAQALVVAEQRNSLASELHDSVTQILFSASVLAEATPRIWGKDQKIAHQNMEKISTLLRGALAEMRSLLFELRSGGPQSQPLEKLLTTLVDAVQARTQITVSKNIDDASEMPENVIQAFYRIAREALNNVVTHADANQVTICLRNEPHCLELRIQDDGRGFDPKEIPVGHLGITIMAERAVQIGGDLQIKSEPGHGTEIVVTWSNKGEES